MDSRNKIFAVIGTVAILGTAGFLGMTLFMQQDDKSLESNNLNNTSNVESNASTTEKTNTTPTTPSVDPAISYKDGTYTSTKSYSVPRGNTNSITATVTIVGGKITSVTTDNTYADGDSAEYIDGFKSSVSADATGESIENYSPSRISGASLTTRAFSNAISSIRTEAKS